ncbi:uncharacterized protein ColSpa_01166 [Colletotrichum spaethianum]|uniref:Uncharacterized protein n=1 Tax=Colletotrichum spaethianum TaxID=700344 RepID=A0AA37NW59_9PEZI|nr:uncharacterized protein ColSpa_01166 [Colletotrichum spaethianum]GKT40985.1 hypothetical protein ColSpa_01166 [Colletotrichum spaethianum]
MVYPSLSLATLSLAALTAASPIVTQSRQPSHNSAQSALHKLPYSKIRKYLGATDGEPIAPKMIPGVGNKWQCFDREST